MSFPLDPSQQPPAMPGMAPGMGAPPDPGMMPQQPGMGIEPPVDPASVLPPRPADAVSYAVKMTQGERSELGARLSREIERYRTATVDRRDNAAEWRANCEVLPNDADGPWENSAALRACNTAWACDGHTTRLNTQIVQADPPFSVVATAEEALPHVDAIQEALKALLEEAAWEEVARDAHRELPIVGNCLIRTMWEKRTRWVPRIQVDVDEELHGQLLNSGASPSQAFAGSVKADDNGVGKVFLAFEEITEKDGLDLKVIPFEDMVVLPYTCRDPESAWGLGERVMIRGQDLILGAKAGRYDKDAVDDLLNRGSDPLDEEQEDRDDEQGVDTAEGYSTLENRYKEFLCYDLAILDILDSAPYEKWYLVTVHPASKTLLRVQYLPFEHGRCPYVWMRYLTRVGQLWGSGIAERLAVIQDAATASVNQFSDLVDLMVATAGNFFYSDGALDITKFKYAPGTPVRVEDINGIKEMTFAQGIPVALTALMEHMGQLKEWGELLSATSNPALGRETQGQKTLGEVQLVMSAGMQTFEDYASGVALCWAKVWDQCRWLIAQHADSGTVRYRRSPSPGQQAEFLQVPAEVLCADVDLEPAGLNAFPDAQTRAQVSTLVNQLFLAHPLTAQNPDILEIGLKNELQDYRFRDWKQVMELVKQQVDALKMQQQQQAAMEQAAAQQQLQAGDIQNASAQQQMGLAQQKAAQDGRASEQGAAQANQAMQIAQQKAEIDRAMAAVGLMQSTGALPPPPTANGSGKKK